MQLLPDLMPIKTLLLEQRLALYAAVET